MTIPNADATNFLEEDASAMSLQDIYNQLLVHSELIIKIPRTEEKKVRTGLASVKGKQNQKLKDSGLRPDNTALSFQISEVLDAKGKPDPDNINMKILLGKRSTVKVLSISLPDTEI